MRLRLLALGVAAVIITASCKMNVLRGEGARVSVTPPAGDFDAVDIDVPLKAVINIREGAAPGLEFRGYQNIIRHLRTTVEHRTLRIYSDLDDTWSIEGDEIEAEVTMPSIRSLSLEGAPGAEVHGNVTGAEFDLDISGAANVEMDQVTTDKFSATVSGAANIKVNGGSVKQAVYDISGAGKIRAYGLQAANVQATITGAGTSEVSASQTLAANISGAGTIRYKGHPSLTQEISGVGSLKDAN